VEDRDRKHWKITKKKEDEETSRVAEREREN
jgi:hypothetical protein